MQQFKKRYLNASSDGARQRIFNSAILNLSKSEADEFIKWQISLTDDGKGMTTRERSDAIIGWLSEHQLISRNLLCQMIGYDASNLQKAFDGVRHIPAKHIEAFENELKKYGFGVH